MAETICNTSPLQYLFQAGHLELLPALYGTITVPLAVSSELAEGRRLGVPLPDIEALDWIRIRQAKEHSLLPLVADLGSGEREVLSLALELPGSLAVLDDWLGRRYALHLGLRLIGTLGVLLLAKQRGHLKALRPVVEELERLGFRLDPATRKAVLRLAGEAL